MDRGLYKYRNGIKIARAYCDSNACATRIQARYKKVDGTIAQKVVFKPSLKENITVGTMFCADCESALIWKRGPERKTYGLRVSGNETNQDLRADSEANSR